MLRGYRQIPELYALWIKHLPYWLVVRRLQRTKNPLRLGLEQVATRLVFVTVRSDVRLIIDRRVRAARHICVQFGETKFGKLWSYARFRHCPNSNCPEH